MATEYLSDLNENQVNLGNNLEDSNIQNMQNSNNEDNGTGKTTTNMFIQTEALYGDTVSRVRWINWQISGIGV